MNDVIIIGGGIAGLACAVELCRSGLSVTLLEASARLGGRARSWEDERTGDTVDIGPHIILTEYRNMLRLLRVLGTADQIKWRNDKFITLVGPPHPVDIKTYPLPAPLHFAPSLLRLPQASLIDLASNSCLMWRTARLTEQECLELDQHDAESFLQQMGVTRKFIDWFWRSACITILNAPLESCSAGALLRFFRFMMGHSGYKIGFAGKGLGDLFVPGSQSCIREHGGQILLNSPIQRLAFDAGAASVTLTDGSMHRGRTCVCAVPPAELQAILPEGLRRQEASLQTLERFGPSPYIGVYLWFDRKLTGNPFWARTWHPDNLNYDFYDLSNIRTGWGSRPSVIASNIIHSRQARQLADEEIVQRTLTELADYLPVVRQAKLQHRRVHRIPMAVPAPRPGIEALRPTTKTAIEGLFLAGDWTNTKLPSSMESAVRSGFLAAEAVMKQLGRPSHSAALPPPEAEGLVRLIGGP